MHFSFSSSCSLPVRSRDYVIYSVARPLQQKGAKRGTLFILSLVSLVLTAQLCCVCEIRLGGKTKLCPWCWKERNHTLWPSCFFSIFIFCVLFVATVIWSMASCVPVVVVVIADRSADCTLTTKTVILVPFLKIIFLSFLSCWFCQVEVCVCCVCVSTFQLTASAD